tara:strand:- start:1246 stop:1893 length:648 start_codon:yes stop_codon:yes gene_type:complete
MKTGKKGFSLYELENLFAEKFDSPIFPILADFYLNNSEIDKALQVSTIGLKHSPDNFLGQYVLAKIHIINNNFIEAEKLLINTIISQPCNIEAIITLIKIKISLNRSQNTIKKYINCAFTISPNHSEIKSLYNKYCKPNDKRIIQKNKKVSSEKKSSMKFDNHLATRSMYNVLMNQQKHNEALQVLQLMSKKKTHISFVKKEKKKLLKITEGIHK